MLMNKGIYLYFPVAICAAIYSLTTVADQSEADRVKQLRIDAMSKSENESYAKISSDEREKRQTQIDAEVTYNFKKRIQMRPSDVKKIDPACDQWLLMYQETWSLIAKEGIKSTCP